MANISSSTPPTTGIPIPPEGVAFLAVARPSLILLLIGTIWTSMLVPLIVALLFFSTRDLRRKPIFILNLIAISLGFAVGIFNFIVEYHAIMSPRDPMSIQASIAFTVVAGAVPIFVESILLFRLLAVYPPSRTRREVVIAIFGTLGLLKIARIVNVIIFMANWAAIAHQLSANPLIGAELSWTASTRRGMRVEFILQVLDNSIASGLFIHRLNIARMLGNEAGSHASYTSQIKALFWIAVSNFVFPVMLSIATLVCNYQNTNVLYGAAIYVTNGYVAIIGVLLATVWAAGTHWSEDSSTATGNSRSLASIRFKSAQEATNATTGSASRFSSAGQDLNYGRGGRSHFEETSTMGQDIVLDNFTNAGGKSLEDIKFRSTA
ncbi:hypothetical protein C8J56DRAFT_884557 [Mycena floridula]|nr:hypothetical protein C8J56DRAFT_884557 [Mycena floridula]